MIGVLFAILSSLFFGLYIIPRKLSKLSGIQFSTLMALGFTIGSSALYLVQIAFGNNEGLGDPDLLYAILAGVMWATALSLLVKSIDLIGLARSNQWKNLQGPVAVVLALVVIGESETVQPILAILSGLAIFTSAAALNVKGTHSKSVAYSGVLLAISSGILFGTVAIISKHVVDNAGVYSQQVILSCSILASLVVFQLVTRSFSIKNYRIKREFKIAISSGFLYLGASSLFLLAFEKIEASIAFTIVQMNFLVVLALGIFTFKEYSFRENKLRVVAGIGLATVGVILLAFAR